MYQAFLLLKPDTDFTLAEARRRLADKFPQAEFTADGDSLAMATEDWDIALRMNAGPHVLAESQRIAELVTGGEDNEGIGACIRRVEIASDVPDPEMAHFNDYLLVIEVMQSFRGAIAIDPSEPCVL